MIYKGEEKIFTSKHIEKKGKEISYTSCHNFNVSQDGKNIFTNKIIKPLSPKTHWAKKIIEHDLEYYTRTFIQKDSSRSQTGYGLGFDIVKRILDHHNFILEYIYEYPHNNFIIFLNKNYRV